MGWNMPESLAAVAVRRAKLWLTGKGRRGGTRRVSDLRGV